MKITTSETYVELHPETDFELEAIRRLSRRGSVQMEIVDPPGARNWPVIEHGCSLRLNIPPVPWGT